MKDVFNYNELLVEECMDEIYDKYPNLCKCEQCKKDIYALALNSLPPFYVVTIRGKIAARYLEKASQFSTDVLVAVTNACEKVIKNPYHK